MKRVVVCCLLAVSLVFADVPFNRGVNITGWFQTLVPRHLQFTKFTKQDLINIKSLGCDVIRLPIFLQHMHAGPPEYKLDPILYHFLDQVIDWAEELEIYLILDYHTYDATLFTDPNLEKNLIAIWTQLATRYKDRSNYILYEIANEPNNISITKWGRVQGNVINAIRKVDEKHTIIVTGTDYGHYNTLDALPKYTDQNLIYTFHFYDPFLFTCQGADWVNPPLTTLAGVPFPYDPLRMPVCPKELRGTWVETSLKSYYKTDGTPEKVKELIDTAIRFRLSRNVPVYCGEFGAYMPNCENQDRVRYYDVVANYLSEQNIPWTMWDYTGGFGIFRHGGNDLFEHDVNVELVNAMGLNAPPQTPFVLRPDSTGFDLYTDYYGEHLREQVWAGNGVIDLYSEDQPAKGKFCIKMSDVEQYCFVGFRFKPIKDLSKLVEKGYALDIYLRCDNPQMSLDVRFVDTKTEDPNDHPWRMKYSISRVQTQWDGQWKHLQIPLKNFTEGGSWDNAWYNPEGKFDWQAVEQFQIIAEHHSFKGRTLYIDHVRIVDPQVVKVDEPVVPETFRLTNYPNPFNPRTTISYRLPVDANVRLTIYNSLGQTVRVLTEGKAAAGSHSAVWDGLGDDGLPAPSGLYFYRLQTDDFTETQKMMLLR